MQLLTDISSFKQSIIVENLDSKIKYRKFDEISAKLSQILNTKKEDIETLLYSTSIENAFYIEEIANKIITAYWKNKLSAGECGKLIEYIYLNYSVN